MQTAVDARLAPLVDIGANLTHDSFDADREAVLQRAWDAGLEQIVVTGADLASSEQALALAQAQPGRLFATAGMHPHHASDYDAAADARFRELAAYAEVRAVGEMGLDYFRNFSPRPAQIAAFEQQLQIAVDLGKPVFLHQRDAHPDFLAVLKAVRPQLPAALVHCFTDSRQALEDYLALDCHIGITGWICDERRGLHVRKLVPLIPADRLMLETDAPYLLPRNLQPRPSHRRNEPMYLPHVCREVATCRGENPQQTAAASTATARAFFGLPA